MFSHASDEGISVQSAEGEYFGTPSGPISGLSVTGNTVTDSASGLGIWDYSTGHAGVWSTTVSDISGNTFDRNTYQISTDFTGANLTPLLGTNTFDATAINAASGTTIYGDLQTAVDGEAAGSTLDIAGTFTLTSELVVDQDVSLAGGASRATIAAGADFTAGGAAGAMILVEFRRHLRPQQCGRRRHRPRGLSGPAQPGRHDRRQCRFPLFSPAAPAASPMRAWRSRASAAPSRVALVPTPMARAAAPRALTVTNSTFENIGREGIW